MSGAIAFLKRLVGKDERIKAANAKLDAQIKELDESASSIDSFCKRLDEVEEEAKKSALKKVEYKRTISGELEAVRVVQQTPTTGRYRGKLPSGT